jgi:hypothetical protein
VSTGPSGLRATTLVLGLLLVTGCGDDMNATQGEQSEIQSLLSDVAEEVEDLGDPAPTSSVPPTTVDDAEEGLDHRKVALQGLGEDDDLDLLAVLCFDKDLSSCDDLYVGSPDGSLYEAYGATCGARVDQPTNLLCVDVLVGAGGDPAGLGRDAFPNELARLCYAGDLVDCDILFAEADRNSVYEAYGASCGERLSAQTDLDCTELVP